MPLMKWRALFIYLFIYFIHFCSENGPLNTHFWPRRWLSGIISDGKQMLHKFFPLLWVKEWAVTFTEAAILNFTQDGRRKWPQLVCDGFWNPYAHTCHHAKFKKLGTKCTIHLNSPSATMSERCQQEHSSSPYLIQPKALTWRSRSIVCQYGNYIAQSHNFRDLGITIDSDLKFKSHIHNIVTTASQRSALILRCFLSRNPDSLVRAFKIYVRPLLQFASTSWSPSYFAQIFQIESVQRTFTNRVPGCQRLSHITNA